MTVFEADKYLSVLRKHKGKAPRAGSLSTLRQGEIMAAIREEEKGMDVATLEQLRVTAKRERDMDRARSIARRHGMTLGGATDTAPVTTSKASIDVTSAAEIRRLGAQIEELKAQVAAAPPTPSAPSKLSTEQLAEVATVAFGKRNVDDILNRSGSEAEFVAALERKLSVEHIEVAGHDLSHVDLMGAKKPLFGTARVIHAERQARVNDFLAKK